MFKRFIAVTEWTGDSDEFIKRLHNLRKVGAEECLLVEGFSLIYPSLMDPVNLAGVNEIQQAIAKQLAVQKSVLEKQGYVVKTRLIEGLTVKNIVQIARDE